MPTRLAEDLDEQIGTAVDDLGLIAKIRLGIDHSKQFDDGIYAAEVPQGSFGHRQQVQANEPSFLIAFLDRHGLAQSPHSTAAIRPLWSLAGNVQ